MKIDIDIPFPEGALDEGAMSRVRRDALEAAILRLFVERRISSAEGAEDLGLTRIQFMELARSRGVPHHDYTADDLNDDLADLVKIEQKLSPRGSGVSE